MWETIWGNRQWVFSGVGVTVLLGIVYVVRRLLRHDNPPCQSQTSGAHSVNVQAGRDVSIGKPNR